MTINFIAYAVFAYFLGLIFSAGFALLGKQWKKSIQLFVLSNLVGFVAGVSFLLNFSSRQIILARVDWFFHFLPTLNLLSAIFFTFISLVSALVGIYSFRYLELYKETYNPALTQFLIVVFVFGMQGVLFASNSFSFLLLWEVMSISSFFLVFADGKEQSLKAAFFYFVMTHLGASAILGGFLILGNGSILFDFANLTAAWQNLAPALQATTFLLFLFGFGSKAGLVPFHVWLPEAHPEAPSNVSALMSGLMLKVAVYGFIRVVFAFAGLPSWAGLTVIALGLLSGIVGGLHAAVERDLKRAFAFSSIENLGIIFTMLGTCLYLLAQNAGSSVIAISNLILVFAIFHAINHAFFKTALFLASGVAINRFHSRSLEVMGGLAKIMPFFSLAFLLAILGSLPMPPFGTFFGEWGFIQSVITLLHDAKLGTEVAIVLVAVLALLGLIGGLATFAMVKVFGISMLGLARNKHVDASDEKKDWLLSLPIMGLALTVATLGFFAKPLIEFLNFKANLLTSGVIVRSYVSGNQLSSMVVFLVPAFLLAGIYLLYVFFKKEIAERSYQTWDCGQPINETMEYSATAFSAPIRFFFLQLIKRSKKMQSKPVVETNPWIRNYTFALSFNSIWKDALYQPIIFILKFIAERVKVLQGGRIQYYLLFVLGTLIVTLIIFL
jgi:hydrogenase-4 component B